MRFGYLTAVLSCGLVACAPERELSFPLLAEVVGDTTATVRGINLGATLASIDSAEGEIPAILDSLGPVYRYPYSSEQQLEVAYYVRPLPQPDTAAPTEYTLQAVVLHLELSDEQLARRFLTAFADHTTDRYGIAPTGNLGQQQWQIPVHDLLIEALLTLEKEDVTLNFARLNPPAGTTFKP